MLEARRSGRDEGPGSCGILELDLSGSQSNLLSIGWALNTYVVPVEPPVALGIVVGHNRAGEGAIRAAI